MKTMKQFIEKSHVSPGLVRSVVRQSGGWESFQEMASDIANHGIDGGFHGWINYSDTCKFFRNNKALIMELAEQQADDFGQGVFAMIQGFGVFRNDPITVDALAKAVYTGKGEDVETVHNVLAWYAAEEVARSYSDLFGEN